MGLFRRLVGSERTILLGDGCQAVERRCVHWASAWATWRLGKASVHHVQSDEAVLSMVERSGHRGQYVEAERLPQVHRRRVCLDNRVELDRPVPLAASPVDHLVAQCGADPWFC